MVLYTILFWICQDSPFGFLFAIWTVKGFYLSFQFVSRPDICDTLALFYCRWKCLCPTASLAWSGCLAMEECPQQGVLGWCWQILLWPEIPYFSSSCNSSHLLELISWIVIQELQFSSFNVGKLEPSLLAVAFIKKEIRSVWTRINKDSSGTSRR